MTDRARLIAKLEARLRHLATLLYDTGVPAAQVDAEVLPHCDEQIVFTDPWQQGGGVARYRLGLAGFHAMLKFDFAISQLNVTLDEEGRRGRAIVDGVMQLRLLEPLLTYPLRTILVFDFAVTDEGRGEAPVGFRITNHEELWSFGDMLAAVPAFGWAYTKLFRPGFARAFLAASYLSSKAKGWVPE